jgi:biotin transport system substrate-specific component
MSSSPSLAWPVRRSADDSRLLARSAAAVVGSSLLWASAKVQVPLWPVPMTMQTYVVLTMGVLLGWRLGAATMALYLAEGAFGLPVFAGTPANGIGVAYIFGPTGGYLGGYLAAVLLVGILAARTWTRSILGTAAVLLIGELAILSMGCCWLTVQFGWERAVAVGFGPFLVGDALKLALATVTVTFWRRSTQGSHP